MAKFELNEQTLSVIEEIGSHMPGGFFIYRTAEPEEIVYANRAVMEIFGCGTPEEFRRHTGNTFRGMVHPEDYHNVSGSIVHQISQHENQMDHVEYRIIRRDGAVRWVEDYGHLVETRAYGGIYVVFLSDVTEKHLRQEAGTAERDAVIATLFSTFNTVWLINDVQTESCSLYYTDKDEVHSEAIRNALSHARYTDTKTQYVSTMVAAEDRERMQEQIGLPYILKQFEARDVFSVNFLRELEAGPRHYRINFGKVYMPGGKTGVMMGFKDVEDEFLQEEAFHKAIEEARRAEEENRKLTEEVQAAAQFADLMASMSSLLTNMPAMSFSKDIATGKYLACNQAFSEFAGKTRPEEVVGLTDHQIFDRETADHFVEDDHKAIAMDGAYIFFEDVPDATGSVIRNLQTTKTKFRDTNGRMCLLGMCVDVTEMTRVKTAEAAARAKQQELEEKLALQERLLAEKKSSELQNQMITALGSDYWSIYLVQLDRDEGICYQESGDDKDFKIGQRFPYVESIRAYADEFVTDEYRAEFLAFTAPDAIREGLRKQRVISYRYQIVKAGSPLYVMIRFAGVRHPEDRDDGRVHSVGLSFSNVDAETRQSLEQNRVLSEALAAAEDASKAKTAFLSNMSHEIRTPMNAIIGLNNIAMNDPSLSDRVREYLVKIGASAHHLLDIINDILDMSRIESGRLTIKSEEFSFAKMLEQVNTIISGQCRDKGVAYECRIRGDVRDSYIGDDMKLRQVMINILGNAVKFTPEGGRVTLVVEAVARFDGKSTLRLTFSDTGIGMSREYLPKLFDAFSQEDSSSTNRYGSTGLGMPITKSIVELMNGNIEVESEKGVGTTFTVTVTLLDSDRRADERDVAMPHPDGMKVLVIDDDPVACEHARIILGQVGISCDEALSGLEGIEMVKLHHARRAPYNLILVDWRMPDLDGIETTRQIRLAVGDETPIIILTSYSWEDIEDEARAAGVDTFVAKPLFAGNVLDQFREAFKRKNARLEHETADLRGRRVLLAEDVAVNAEIMIMVMAMRELEVEHAENGRVAVEMFEGHEPGYYDAVLMDMRMPEMDGIEASRRIRAMERADAKTIPIIALTANAFDEDVQRSMQAGLNAHLSKPVEPEALFRTLEGLIR